LKEFTTIGCNNLAKKCKDLFDAIVDDLIKALEQQTWCKFHLMGKLKGMGLNQINLCLKVAQRFSDPKKIAHVIASFVYGSLMHSKIVGLEGKKKLGSCKKKLDIMIGSLINSHHLEKINFLVPQQSNPTMV
jgi:hypothetical protein